MPAWTSEEETTLVQVVRSALASGHSTREGVRQAARTLGRSTPSAYVRFRHLNDALGLRLINENSFRTWTHEEDQQLLQTIAPAHHGTKRALYEQLASQFNRSVPAVMSRYTLLRRRLARRR